MSTTKFLFLYRTPAGAPPRQPSPEEMQGMYARWHAWKADFDREIVDIGDGLKSAGVVYKAGAVTDGPFIEAKEVMGGYSIVAADSVARALEIAKTCPINLVPGASIEVRELMGH